MRIKKISPTTPANGNIENQYGTSQTNAYSEEYSNTTFATKDVATTSANGLMSSSDKSKLDDMAINDTYGTSSKEGYSQNYINVLGATLGCHDLGEKKSSFDLNDLKPGETCYWSTGSANQPGNAPCQGGRVYCFRGYGVGGQYPFQIAFYYDANTIYIRHKWVSWSAWRTI